MRRIITITGEPVYSGEGGGLCIVDDVSFELFEYIIL